MSDKFFLDTNILVYSFDSREKSKRKVAQELIESAFSGHLGVISYQVVQEFLSVALRKFEKPFSAKEARGYLDQVLNPLCEIFPSADLYRNSLEIKESAGFSFYDALIVASALQAGCKTIYSENLQGGQRISGLTIQNPF